MPALLAQADANSIALAWVAVTLGAVLALLSGLAAWSAMAGRLQRAVLRHESRRILTGCALLDLASALLIGSGLLVVAGSKQSYFEMAQTGDNPVVPIVVLFARLVILGTALWPPLLCTALGLLLGVRQGFHQRSPGIMLRLGAAVGNAFAFWWPRSPIIEDGHGTGAAEQPDLPDHYELTLASGELVEAEEREYIENILEFGETTARDVMRPRPDVVALDSAWPATRILGTIADSRYSRFPVYEVSIDNVIGILHLRDVLEFLARGENIDKLQLRTMLMEAYYVPDSKKADDILRELQRSKNHMAIVLDEYGGTAGILTIEDLLEEIVGEIQDEYDDEARLYHQREDGAWVIDAQLALDELNEVVGAQFVAEDIDTLGGLVIHHLGHIPNGDEMVQLDSEGKVEVDDEAAAAWRLTVLSVERNRVGRVLVEKLGQT